MVFAQVEVRDRGLAAVQACAIPAIGVEVAGPASIFDVALFAADGDPGDVAAQGGGDAENGFNGTASHRSLFIGTIAIQPKR